MDHLDSRDFTKIKYKSQARARSSHFSSELFFSYLAHLHPYYPNIIQTLLS